MQKPLHAVRTHALVSPLAAALIGVSSLSAVGQQFVATPLGTLGGPGSVAYGVNDAGQVVGAADADDGSFHAFVWDNGTMIDLGTLTGGDVSSAHSINNAGVIVGRSHNASGVDRAVRWVPVAPGQWQIEDLGTLKPDDTGFGWATRINDNGQIVGYATASSGSYHAFRWTSGTMMDLGTLSYSGPLAYSQGLGINDAGKSVGFAYQVLGGPEHGMYHDGAAGQDITPADSFALAQGHNINSSDVIVGYISTNATGGAFRAATYPPRGPWQLIPLLPGTSDSYGYDINDAGVVVGTSFLAGPSSDFFGLYYDGTQSINLNDVTTGAPAQIVDAYDISNTALIAANSADALAPMALLLSPAPDCPGDVDGDDDVDLADLSALLEDFGVSGTPGMPGDLDGDDDVDLADLSALLENFGASCGA